MRKCCNLLFLYRWIGRTLVVPVFLSWKKCIYRRWTDEWRVKPNITSKNLVGKWLFFFFSHQKASSKREAVRTDLIAELKMKEGKASTFIWARSIFLCRSDILKLKEAKHNIGKDRIDLVSQTNKMFNLLYLP